MSSREKPAVRTYKVGDVVLIRSFSSMLNEFGTDGLGSIKTRICFFETMAPLCGSREKIAYVSSEEGATTYDYWFISPDMIVGGGAFRR